MSRNSPFRGSEQKGIEGNRKEFRNNMFFKFSSECFSISLNCSERVSKSFLSFNGSERNSEWFSLLRNGSEWNSEHFYLPWNRSKQNHEVQSVFSVMVRYGIPSTFIFRRMAWNEIPSFFRTAKQTEFQWNKSKKFFSENWRLASPFQGQAKCQRMPTPSGRRLNLGIIPVFLLGINITYCCPYPYFGYAKSRLI